MDVSDSVTTGPTPLLLKAGQRARARAGLGPALNPEFRWNG